MAYKISLFLERQIISHTMPTYWTNGYPSEKTGVSSLSLQNDDFTKTVIQADISTCKSHD